MSSHPPLTSQSGVALITTVIVVAVLAVVAVAFMQSTSVDRLSSRTVRDYFEAQLAAEAAATIGSGELARLLATYPDSATAWQNIGGARTNEATVLYVRAQAANTNTGARPGQHGSAIALLARPLVSGGALVPLGAIGSAVPFAGPGPAQVNLNATNATQPVPLVGLRSMTNGGAPVTAANWIYVGRTPGPTNAANPAIARYAYWIEDESFKVNLNIATNGARGAVSLGTGPREIRIDGSFGSSSNIALRSVNLANVMTARRGLPAAAFPSASTAAIPAGLQEQAASDELRFISTVNSAGLDISRGGFKRFNINSVTNGITGPVDANNIRINLNRLITAITNSNSVPDFGQRFYRLSKTATGINSTNAVPAPHSSIYLNKIAANVLDYVDADSQPTIVLNNPPEFGVLNGPQSLENSSRFFNEGIGGEGTNRIAATGLESRPFLQGYAIGVQVSSMNPVGFNSNSPPPVREASFELLVDHYFEFWNPSSRDIVIGTGTDTNLSYIENLSLQVGNAPGWIDNSTETKFAEPGTKDFQADFAAGTRFPANQLTLVTTAPIADARRFAPSAQNIVSVHSTALDSMRSVSGVTKNVFNTNSGSFPLFNRFFGVSLNFRNPGGSQIDFETEMLLGSSFGVVEMFPALTLNSQRIWARSNNAVFTNRSTLAGNLRSGAPDGLAPRSTEGDPRTLMEQLQLQPVATGSTENPNQTRLFVDSQSTTGTPNSTYVRPTDWVDYSSFAPGSANAPMIVRNSAMTSIGEMGNLVDPSRVPGTRGAGTPSLTNVIYARSGGRTLRIGQPEHPDWYWNIAPGRGSQTEASRTWTSWRLADVFTTTAPSNNLTAADPLGVLTNNQGVVRGPTNTNGAVLTIPGLINPNGALRDNGAALRAVLHGIEFLPSPDGAPSTAGRRPDTNGITAVVTNLISRMTNSPTAIAPSGSLNVLWERGEISELPLFNSGTTLASVNMSNTFDRGREEVVRRSIEMLTTRGSIFTVYAIGQTLAPDGRVSGTARLKQVVEFTPVYTNAPAAFADNFDPSVPEAVADRFAPPVNYSISVLSSAYE